MKSATSTEGNAWKDGDWCFFEFKLCQIVVKDGKVQEASDGMFRTSGHDLSYACRPLTLRNANLTQHAEHWSDKLHKEGHGGLNYPDIHRKLVELWCASCDSQEGDLVACEAVGEFARKVLAAIKNTKAIDGVPLLRQRLG